MSYRAAVLGYVLVASAAAAASAQRPTRCKAVLENTDHNYQQVTPFANNTISYLGGNVRFYCEAQRYVRLGADSVEMINQEIYRFYAGHKVRATYRDSAYTIAADTLVYTVKNEEVVGWGDVVVTDLKAGSTLRGPHLIYDRAVQGVREKATITALITDGVARPTVRYFGKPSLTDTARGSPYLLTADQLHGFGQSQFWGMGKVTVDRDSLHGRGDSLAFVSGKSGVAQLFGKPATLRRVTNDSFQVSGKEVRLNLDDDRLRDVRAFGGGRVTRGVAEIVGDSVSLAFTLDKLSQALAWDRKNGAVVHTSGYDTSGDSVVIDSPGEQLREVRVFRKGVMQSPKDTSTTSELPKPDSTTGTDVFPAGDKLWGDRIIARFDQVDSAGTMVTRVRQIQSFGSARSFSRHPINYALADTIVIFMKGGDSTGVSRVLSWGHVSGAYSQKAAVKVPPKDSAKVAVPVKHP